MVAAVSPPFREWEKYYIIPANILQTLKTLAYDHDSKDGSSTSIPQLDLSALIKDAQGERILIIANERGTTGSTMLSEKAWEETLWSVKENLEENIDFQFISGEGWANILEW